MQGTEPKELIELCMNCTLPDCVGRDGCKAYSATKKKYNAPSAPNITVTAITPEAKLLVHFNSAIKALTSIAELYAMDVDVPTNSVQACLRDLKRARSDVYDNLVDWDAIAASANK